MPLIDIHVLEGVFDDAEKRQLIEGCARVFGDVAGQMMQDNISVRVHEVPSGAWGGANGVWTTEKALAIKRGEAPAD